MLFFVALEGVARIDALFDIERGINGMSVEEWLAARQEHARRKPTVRAVLQG